MILHLILLNIFIVWIDNINIVILILMSDFIINYETKLFTENKLFDRFFLKWLITTWFIKLFIWHVFIR